MADPRASVVGGGPSDDAGVIPSPPPAEVRRGPSRAHVPALDGVRGAAIAAVLLYHLFFMDRRGVGAVDRVYRVFTAGWIGVDLFFVLSGFLITGILLETRSSPGYFRTFFGRRAVRVFPLYFGMLAVGWAVSRFADDPASAGPGGFRAEQGWLWSYLTNVKLAAGGWINFNAGPLTFSHFWSLAIEEQFYLVWPAVVYLCPSRLLLPLMAAVAAASAAARSAYVLRTGDPTAAYVFTPFRLDSLMAGAAVAVLVRRPAFIDWWRGRGTWPAYAALATIVAVYVPTRWERERTSVSTVGYSVLAVAFGVVVAAVYTAADGCRLRRLAEARPARVFGRLSYGLYAVHLAVFALVVPPLTPVVTRATHSATLGDVAAKAVAVVVAVAVAAVSWYGYERPFLRLKRFFGPDGVGERAL